MSSTTTTTSTVTKVVIVGAGASARLLTKALKATSANKNNKAIIIHITVIQPNTFASIPHYQTLVLAQQETLIGNSTFESIAGADETIYGVAKSCRDGVLLVEPLGSTDNNNGSTTSTTADPAVMKEVEFDILVAATGSSNPVIVETPGQTLQERQMEVDQVAHALLNGEHVVIAGGGATGVELAGDVMEARRHHNKGGTMTLICSGDRLIADQPPEYSDKSYQILEQMGVTVIFNDRVSSHTDTTIADDNDKPFELILKSGKKLPPCHAYVAAYNRGPNTQWLADLHTEKKILLNDKKQIITNEYLQSPTYHKLYAMGATNDRAEAALTMNVEAQAKTVAANIVKTRSTKQSEGLARPPFQPIGATGFLIPDNLPIPSFLATICCNWCGFPINLLCPCYCAAVVIGPVDVMTCGYCCGPPEGEGLIKTKLAIKRMGIAANHVGYNNLGQQQPTKHTMERS